MKQVYKRTRYTKIECLVTKLDYLKDEKCAAVVDKFIRDCTADTIYYSVLLDALNEGVNDIESDSARIIIERTDRILLHIYRKEVSYYIE